MPSLIRFSIYFPSLGSISHGYCTVKQIFEIRNGAVEQFPLHEHHSRQCPFFFITLYILAIYLCARFFRFAFKHYAHHRFGAACAEKALFRFCRVRYLSLHTLPATAESFNAEALSITLTFFVFCGSGTTSSASLESGSFSVSNFFRKHYCGQKTVSPSLHIFAGLCVPDCSPPRR